MFYNNYNNCIPSNKSVWLLKARQVWVKKVLIGNYIAIKSLTQLKNSNKFKFYNKKYIGKPKINNKLQKSMVGKNLYLKKFTRVNKASRATTFAQRKFNLVSV